MIWHIYSGQCCLMGDSAIHLPSSGEVLLVWGRSPASPLVSATSPEDGRSIPSTLPTVNVPNHVRNRWLKNEDWLISSKLTGDLPHCESIIPSRQQVHTWNPLEAVLPRVNVPNHVRSCWLKNKGWPIYSKLTGDLSHGRGCLPWRGQVPATIPWGTVQVWVNVPNHIRSHQLKNEVWPICSKLTGYLTHGRDWLPWRWQVPATIPQWAVQVWVNVPNHIRSRRPWMMHHPG